MPRITTKKAKRLHIARSQSEAAHARGNQMTAKPKAEPDPKAEPVKGSK